MSQQLKAINDAIRETGNEASEWRRLLAIVDIAKALQEGFDAKHAEKLLRQAEESAKMLDNHWGCGWVLAAIGRVFAERGDSKRLAMRSTRL